MGQKKLMKWFAMFFAAMILFTVVSRAADSVNVAQVSVKACQNQIVVHKAEGAGKVEGVRERAVFTLEGLQVERVMVQEGQTVKKGDVLLKLTGSSIADMIKEKTRKTEELRRRVGDLESARAAEGAKTASDRNWAAQDWNMAVNSGNAAVANARNAVNIARERLEEYYASTGFSDGTEDRTTEQALQDDVRMKQEALNEAVRSSNRDVASAQKAVEEAGMARARDSSLENAKAELEASLEEMEKLTKLEEKKGKVRAPSDGVVKTMASRTGSLTSAEAAVILYETEGDFLMKGSISEEDARYVEIGGTAELKGDGKDSVTGTVQSITQDETNEKLRIVSIQVPKDGFSIGETADFTISKEEGPYSCCVPLSSLYEENGHTYVYVTGTENTVLGDVMIARKVEVSVQDKNGSVAALADGALAGDQKVIYDTDREIRDGSRIRLKES